MRRILYSFVFRTLLGWRIDGNLPDGLKKCVMVVAPHTSNWDFAVGVASRSICRFKANYLMKAELFKIAPLAWFFKVTGGIPVDRKDRNVDVVGNIVKYFEKRERLILAVAPEGTRSHVKEWKTGFYRIADRAKVPIVVVSFDYSQKLVSFIEVFQTTGNMEEDVAYIKSLYLKVKGKNPELGVQ
ncbi:MAG: 1-acyl-sn-glycerol-3-phosphate acyltransferase [Reichenbachiella sp.]